MFRPSLGQLSAWIVQHYYPHFAFREKGALTWLVNAGKAIVILGRVGLQRVRTRHFNHSASQLLDIALVHYYHAGICP